MRIASWKAWPVGTGPPDGMQQRHPDPTALSPQRQMACCRPLHLLRCPDPSGLLMRAGSPVARRRARQVHLGQFCRPCEAGLAWLNVCCCQRCHDDRSADSRPPGRLCAGTRPGGCRADLPMRFATADPASAGVAAWFLRHSVLRGHPAAAAEPERSRAGASLPSPTPSPQQRSLRPVCVALSWGRLPGRCNSGPVNSTRARKRVDRATG